MYPAALVSLKCLGISNPLTMGVVNTLGVLYFAWSCLKGGEDYSMI